MGWQSLNQKQNASLTLLYRRQQNFGYMDDPCITAYFTVDSEAKPQTQARVPVTRNGHNEALNALLYISFAAKLFG